MRWIFFYCWMALAVYGGRLPRRRILTAALLTAGLLLSMTGQLYLLWEDQLLTLNTGLPLHLCSMMALLSLPLLWCRPGWFYGLTMLLGMPMALLALLFPAVVQCSQPVLMSAHFDRVHSLIAAAGLFVAAQKKPLPRSDGSLLLLGSGYLLFVWRINYVLGSNFLFLRAAPSGTPLEWLHARGEGFTLCAYLLLAMVVMRLMKELWACLLPLVTGQENSLAYSRFSRQRTPCTSQDRG